MGPNVLEGKGLQGADAREKRDRATRRLGMEQLPNWLAAAVIAAGMTAYADELYPKVSPDQIVEDAPAPDSIPPLR